MNYPSVLLMGLALAAGLANAELVERSVGYLDGDKAFEGFHVYDDSIKGERPGVLVVHQWTGLSDYEKRRSRMLAELGYNVFALDIYGKGVRPPAPKESAKVSGIYKKDRDLFRERLRLGLKVLLTDARTDRTKVAAVGYCFGGGGVLEMARMGMSISGVVSFHGSLDSTKGFEAKKRKAAAPKVLVLHGAADPYAPMNQVHDLQKELEGAEIDYQIVLYGPGVVHSFTQPHAGNDPSKGAAYDGDADQRSWVAMKTFLGDVFSE